MSTNPFGPVYPPKTSRLKDRSSQPSLGDWVGPHSPEVKYERLRRNKITPSAIKAMPDGIHTITPDIVIRNAGRGAECYKQALGAEERGRIPVPGGKFMQIELWFGDSAATIADEFLEAGVLSPQSIGGNPVVLHFSTENVDPLWKRALEERADVVQPLQDQFWGERYGQIRDPFGYRWGLAQHVWDVPSEAIERMAATIFGGQGSE